MLNMGCSLLSFIRAAALLLSCSLVRGEDEGSHDLSSFGFPVRQPFGSLPVSWARCCPYAAYPIPSRRYAKAKMTFIIGAQESGTTLLFQLLAAHPGVRVSNHSWLHSNTVGDTALKLLQRAKDKHFFNWQPNQVSYGAVEKYMEGFMAGPQDKLSMSKLWLDGTSDYINTAFTACALRAAFPNAKLLVVLRDPVARAFSHWRRFNEKQLWKNPSSFIKSDPLPPFPDEVKAEKKWLEEHDCMFDNAESKKSWNDCFQCNTNHCGDYYKEFAVDEGMCEFNAAGHVGVVANGLYGPQLAWWLSLFPKEQIMVLNSEELKEESRDDVIDNVYTFLGLPGYDITAKRMKRVEALMSQHLTHSDVSKYQASTYIKDLNKLYEFYKPHNDQLYALLAAAGYDNFPKFPTQYVVSQEDEER